MRTPLVPLSHKKLSSSWRLRAVSLCALAVIVLGVTVPIANPPKAHASFTAPTWLVNFIFRSTSKDTGNGIMSELGFQCLGTPFVCYGTTSYDPPRWFYYGIVDTGNGPSGYVRARGWERTNATVIRTFPEAWKLVLFCQTTGDWVYGRWGWTNVWDYVGHYGDAPMFVSDGFVRTGSNGFVAGSCGSTDMGGNP